MQTFLFDGLELSRFMLGTVQFGMPYGIANQSGQPSRETVRSILKVAHEGGVNCLDTAAAYGDSETVLGDALHELGLQKSFTVVTKVRATKDVAPQKIAQHIEDSVVASLKNLRLETLPLCLFHGEADFAHIATLAKLRERGLVQRIGCSVVSTDAARAIVESPLCDALQIPANILDTRFERAGIPDLAKQKNIAVFARSVWLQGLLLMPEEAVPASLKSVVPIRRALEKVARQSEISFEQLAMGAMLAQPNIGAIVVGVETEEQMKRNLELMRTSKLSAEVLERARALVPALPEEVLSPVLWQK